MEKMIDLGEWLKTVEIPVPDYYAVFDFNTGAVTGIYPEHSCQEKFNRIKIDKEIADSIFEGRLAMNHCFVDLEDESLKILQTGMHLKIDDILHRVPEKKHSAVTDPDILITYTNRKIILKLNEKIRNKNIKWTGVQSSLLLTAYNDPHVIYQYIPLTIDDLYKDNQFFDYIGTDEDFSVFTNRIFKYYIFEKYENN